MTPTHDPRDEDDYEGYRRFRENEPWQVSESRTQVAFGVDAALFVIQATYDRIKADAAAWLDNAEGDPAETADALEGSFWEWEARVELRQIKAVLLAHQRAIWDSGPEHAARSKQKEEGLAVTLEPKESDR